MYIAREGKYAKHNDKIEKLEATGSGNMPNWAKADPNFFWKMSDEHERKNGTSYREHVIALPRELSPEQRHELIKDWIAQEIGEKHAYQYAIHNPLAMDGGEQPHAHIMFSERLIDGIDRDPDQYFKRFNAKNPDRGGAKKANTPKLADERKLELKDQRDRWEKLCNSHLELAGSDARISMRSLADQGIDREPISFSMTQIQDKTIKQAYIDLIEAKKELSSVLPSGQAITQEIKRQKSLKFDEFMQSMKDDYELQRIEVEVDQRAEKAAQERLAAEKAAQERLAAEKAAQERLAAEKAEQERLKQEAAEKAEQERLEQEAMEKAAERQRIEKRKPSDLLNKLGARVQIVDADRYGNITTTYKDTTAIISANLHKLIKNGIAKNKEIVITNTDYRGEQVNPEYAQNNTAKAFERFMLQKNVLNDPRILIDFGLGKESLGIRDFAEKYNIKCDFHDLQKLDALNPVAEPQLKVEKPTQKNADPKPRISSSYENSPNYP
uniref:MobA/MobL family protein n=1 Tax=Psychrobacter sp. TaxID=56811 RepID=UPI001E57D04B|nr:MobA/MobL family protein [Psychrobacter sp.]